MIEFRVVSLPPTIRRISVPRYSSGLMPRVAREFASAVMKSSRSVGGLFRAASRAP